MTTWQILHLGDGLGEYIQWFKRQVWKQQLSIKPFFYIFYSSQFIDPETFFKNFVVDTINLVKKIVLVKNIT